VARALIAVAILMSGCGRCEHRTIQKVGACDYRGVCYVRYDDGTGGYEWYPIEGGQAARCK
jgi:hypothetical protein